MVLIREGENIEDTEDKEVGLLSGNKEDTVNEGVVTGEDTMEDGVISSEESFVHETVSGLVLSTEVISECVKLRVTDESVSTQEAVVNVSKVSPSCDVASEKAVCVVVDISVGSTGKE